MYILHNSGSGYSHRWRNLITLNSFYTVDFGNDRMEIRDQRDDKLFHPPLENIWYAKLEVLNRVPRSNVHLRWIE